jgi:UDP-N-acetylmuramoyl-L-alanyl-D-glutamate--2,6-diaminopimelate ligase
LRELAAYLLARGFTVRVQGEDRPFITSAVQDSRLVSEGCLFLALPGDTVDGAQFIGTALRSGAAAALCDEAAARENPDAALVVVNDVVRAAGHAAALLAGNVAGALTLVGVTGTNGKTSCTYLLESVWAQAGVRCGVLGTVAARWPGTSLPAAMTTPALVDLHAMLAQIREADCTVAALEISSHALDQHRVAGCEFEVGIFTNLTRDHLDYHGDEESYLLAKMSLFSEYVSEEGTCVVNADDPCCERMIEAAGARRTVTYSTIAASGADVVVTVSDSTLDGMGLRVAYGGIETELRTRLIGAPNRSNIAAVIAAALALGLDRDTIEAGIATAAPVPGRLERIGTKRPAVLVDYAHTPDALERTLETVRDMVGAGRLICVFGCGGDRDRGKRPMMGRAAGRLADVTVLTSDNPRSEVPAEIIADIEAGTAEYARRVAGENLQTASACYEIEADRERAITIAIGAATASDVVLVAGKGHEDYQEVDGVRRHFDDREVVAAIQERRES